MIIEQTVEIPADRRILLDLPPELPVGKAKITITPLPVKPTANIYDTVTKLRGRAKEMGSSLTVGEFLEMRQEDLRLEEKKYRKLFQKKGD